MNDEMKILDKIIIIGSPGAGKSYFARELSEKTGLPLFHMDNIYWNEDKSHISREELQNEIARIIEEDAWIIDGNYISTLEQRVQASQMVIFMDCSVEQCLDGIRERCGTQRSDMPWVESEPDEEFVEFVKKFQVETKPVIEEILDRYPEKEIVIFKSREEAAAWLLKECD